MKNKNIHLNEDQIICSVVDENDLSANMRAHLSACPACQRQKQAIEQELSLLGDMAKAFAPSPRESIRFSKKPVFFSVRQPLFASGLAVALLVLGVWWASPFLTTSPETRLVQNAEDIRPVMTAQKAENNRQMMTEQLVREMEEDRQLMADIRELEEEALPDFCRDISGTSYAYSDEAFMDFVAPEDTRARFVFSPP